MQKKKNKEKKKKSKWQRQVLTKGENVENHYKAKKK